MKGHFMDYKFFKKVVERRFNEFLPEKYRDMRLEIKKIPKINGEVDSIYLLDERKNLKATPTIYLSDMFEHYNAVKDFDVVIKSAVDKMIKGFNEANNCEIDFNNSDEKIVFQFINFEQNKELLKNIPHRKYLDLAIIYRFVISIEEDGIKSFIINNSILDKLGYLEQDLYERAVVNTEKIFTPTIRSMNDAIRYILDNNNALDEMIEEFVSDRQTEKIMWIISNPLGINGAISMFYEDKLYNLANNINSDLYIMPSSIHEVIAVSSKFGNADDLAKLVREVNLQEVSLNERLSNQVYYYDRELRKVIIATDNNKSLT
ncbi:MAG: DUF5688 family protein [Clostridium sp.]|nr:DUF5688 family protein [Clostridium sp.]